MTNLNAPFIRMAHSLRHGNLLFSLILALFISFAFTACGGDDTDPSDPSDPPVITDPNLPECKLDASRVSAYMIRSLSQPAVGVDSGKFGHACEPDTLIKASVRDSSFAVKCDIYGDFDLTLGLKPGEDTPPVNVTVSAHSPTCRTKTLNLVASEPKQ